jgi:hypothetical protein
VTGVSSGSDDEGDVVRNKAVVVRSALAGAAVAALAVTGVAWGPGQAGGRAETPLTADGPPKETCRGPANGWQGDMQWPADPEECKE